MTERQEKFCEEYLKDRSAAAAARRAGYSAKSACTYAHTLMHHREVRERLGLDGEADVSAETLRLLTQIARGEITEAAVGKDGETIERPAGLRERLKAIELIERRLGAREQGGGAPAVWVIRDDL